MTDSIYDELDDPEPAADDAAPLGDLPAGEVEVFVCDHIGDDGQLCGATFDAAKQLAGHRWGKHHKSKDKAPSGGAGSKAKRASGKRTSARSAASKATPPPVGNRSETYASSIAMMALGAYLVVPPFDTYDLDVVNRGAPNLADALATAAEQNATIRQTCDLILGGGAGGAYIQLLLALSAIVVPICAHHGLVPASAGARFGEMIGAQPPAASGSTEAPPADVDSPRPAQPDFANMGPEEVLQFFSQVPPTVLFDLAGKMFSGVGPEVVDIGGVPTPENLNDTVLNLSMEQSAEEPGDSERGSEQLAPESVPTPA